MEDQLYVNVGEVENIYTPLVKNTDESKNESTKEDVRKGENIDSPLDKNTDEFKNESTKENVRKVIYNFRDISGSMVQSWQDIFKDYVDVGNVKVSKGDIFQGAPAVDALVSPANSFGFMDGGIDMAYSRHFGWQMQTRLQVVIREEFDGEILVGQAAIIPAFEKDTPESETCFAGCNEDRKIKYLISAPTMRVPLKVEDTVNAFLAFRAVILAVQKHNDKVEDENDRISSVLCPGMGTSVGRMPTKRCAYQMLQAYETYEIGIHPEVRKPADLGIVRGHHQAMAEYKGEEKPITPKKQQRQIDKEEADNNTNKS